jgi:neurocalcin delta
MGNKAGKKKSDPTKITEQEISFLMTNTRYTRDEILRWHDGFLKDCPKGELDKKQFTNVFKEFYPLGKAEKFSASIFNVFDTDKSGKIDFTEFLVAISTSSSNDVKQKLHLGFKLYDSNNNGSIDKKEMIKLIEAIYDLTGEDNRKGDNDPKSRCTAIFNKLDKDNNGTLSEAEFVLGCLQDPILMKLLVPQL